MPKITDVPPVEFQEKLAHLSEELDLRIPPKKIERNLLIATWNIRSFGDLARKWISTQEDSPRRDLSSILYIAEIISRFDVIALQEVKSNIRALRDTLRLLGRNWSLILTDVNRGSAGNGERMAYMFDTRRIQLSGLAGEIVVPKEWLKKEDEISQETLTEQFVRSPYAVGFRSEDKTFILVTLHIKYGKSSGDRIAELGGIAKWMRDWASDINAYDQNLIALGDFNIDERGDLLNKTFISQGLHIPDALLSKKVTRSIFDETKYYDQIAWFQDKQGRGQLSIPFLQGGHFDFVPLLWDETLMTKLQFSYRLSDHYPIWGEFDIR